MQAKYKFLFGPVPSRRFGRSLGVDLTPYKTCCHDCVFCQLGRTTNKTVKRKAYVAIEAVLSELKHWLKTDGTTDVITLSGSGEPTLHSRFGEVLEFIRANTSIPAVLLTNGALLNVPEVAKAASHANVVKVSLSAWDQASFEWVNRPHPPLQFDELINGQKTFRTLFKGQLWMEVFLVGEINSTPSNVRKIAALAREIAPDRIQLNTAIRPASEDFVTPLAKEHMSALSRLFQPKAEIIAEFRKVEIKHLRANEHSIFAMLQRRLYTANQIADAFGMHPNEVMKYLGKLIRADQIQAEWIRNTVYYLAVG